MSTKDVQPCHAERSEASRCPSRQTLRAVYTEWNECAQGDNLSHRARPEAACSVGARAVKGGRVGLHGRPWGGAGRTHQARKDESATHCHPDPTHVILSEAKDLVRLAEILRCTQHDSAPPDCRAEVDVYWVSGLRVPGKFTRLVNTHHPPF